MEPETQAKLYVEAGKFAGQVIRMVLTRPRKRLTEEAEIVEESPQKEAPESLKTARTTTRALETAPGAPGEEQHTLEYQLDLLLDDLSHLETEHLPAKGRLLGGPCDCIAKASRSLRRHARETIPIAGREGKDTLLFDAMAQEGDYLMGIGTLEGVKSGKYDGEYLSHAGIISNLRKSVDKMLAEVKSGADCPECEELRRLSRVISESPVFVNTALTKEELTRARKPTA